MVQRQNKAIFLPWTNISENYYCFTISILIITHQTFTFQNRPIPLLFSIIWVQYNIWFSSCLILFNYYYLWKLLYFISYIFRCIILMFFFLIYNWFFVLSLIIKFKLFLFIIYYFNSRSLYHLIFLALHIYFPIVFW